MPQVIPSDTPSEPEQVPPCLIVVGPPRGEALEALIASAPGRVILVEPDPDAAALLEQRGDVTVIAAALGATSGTAELATFNLPGLRSIHVPSPALLHAFPGLQVTSRQTVAAITTAQLLERIGDLSGPVHLRIDAPGSEQILLEGLKDAGLGDGIEHVWLRCGDEQMFEGAASRDVLKTWFLANGFVVESETGADPDWPELTFSINHTARALRQTRIQLAEREDEARSKDERIGELEAALAAQTEAADTARKAARQAQEQLGSANEAAVEQTRHIDELEAALTTQTEAADAARKAARQAQEQLGERQKDVAVALRQQLVIQSDLHELQQRYRESERQRLKQQDVLQKLTPRLQQANEQLQQMALSKDPAAPAPSAGISAKPVRTSRPSNAANPAITSKTGSSKKGRKAAAKTGKAKRNEAK